MIQIIKTIHGRLANKLPLMAVAVFGIGITIFCSASSDDCPDDITLSASLSGCSHAEVSASTTGTHATSGDTVTETTTSTQIAYGYQGDSDCDLYNFDGNGTPVIITLATGLNRLKAHSSDLNKDSNEVDIRVSGGSGPALQINVTKGCPIGTTGQCGAKIDFNFTCLVSGHSYTWSETITAAPGNPACGTCSGGPPSTWTQGADGKHTVNDTGRTVCPAGITHGACDWTCNQSWSLVDNNGGTGLSGTTAREYILTPTPASTKVIVTGDASGTTVCE